MKAKLIKSDIQYRLHNEEGIVIATSTDGKLSIKNCEAIANGYDLDELAKDYAINQLANPNEYEHSIYAATIQNTYMVGFQKALEILGDKKFSEEDMINFAEYCKGDLMKTKDLFNEYQSLQQTEWGVEIEMEYLPSLSYCNKCQKLINPLIPCTDETKSCGNWRLKLDADGCLILKRI